MEHNFLDSRYGKFTASEVHRLMTKSKDPNKMFGDGAMTYIYEKVSECLTGESKPSVSTAATQWGLEHEVDAMKYFEQITGKKVHHYGCNEYVFWDYKDVGGCSPDGLLMDEDATAQVKCPFLVANIVPYLLIEGDRQEWLKKNEKEYYIQCQYEMMCATQHLGRPIDKCYFIIYGGDRIIEHFHRMVVIELTKDEPLQAELDTRVIEAHKILSSTINKLQTPDPIYILPH